MSIEDQIERAIIEGAEGALRTAAALATSRAAAASDGAAVEKHRRDAAAWTACADDVAAMRDAPDAPQPPDEPEPASVDPLPQPVAPSGVAA